ncbi:MAG: hypothetical protein NVS3B14_01230 [Ktedonobacteraceae bacterium]
MAHAPEVEAQRGHPKQLQGLRHLEYHLIVHGSTAQRVRVAHERRVLRFDALFFRLEYAFQNTGRCGDIYM